MCPDNELIKARAYLVAVNNFYDGLKSAIMSGVQADNELEELIRYEEEIRNQSKKGEYSKLYDY